MDIPNFKDILQKLSVFKNNLSLLVSIIVAVVAILLLIPTHLLSSKVKAQVNTQSISLAKRVDQYKRNPVQAVEPEILEARRLAHATDANEIIALAEQTTMRELLSYDIFPEPDPNKGISGLTFVEFGRRYRSGIEGMIASVRGGICPTATEVENGLEDSAARTSRRPGMGFGMAGGAGDPYSMGTGRGRPGMLPGATGRRTEIDRMIIDQMCEARAKSLSVYINPLEIAGFDHWADYKFDPNMVPAVKDAWYHQLAYWVIEDIVDTVEVMNSDRDILSAPFKRIIRLSFTMGLKRPGSRGSTAVIRPIGGRKATQKKDDEESDRPLYVIEDRDGLTESLTARYSEQDGAIDVTHFNLAVVVATRDILPFMQQLCSSKEHKFKGYPHGSEPEQTFEHNQITILESKIGPVNQHSQDHLYYRYGDESVVELDMICEYIFNQKGYEPIKPPAIIDELAGAEPGA